MHKFDIVRVTVCYSSLIILRANAVYYKIKNFYIWQRKNLEKHEGNELKVGNSAFISW